MLNYDTLLQDQVAFYPIIRLPKMGAVIRSYRIGSHQTGGHKKADFQRVIQHYFGDEYEVSNLHRLNTGLTNRPFDIEISLVDKNKKGIRIDIEIDEPYAATSRQATHCKGEDKLRDDYFVDRGWVVIRFSERQVHLDENGCLRYLAEILSSLDSSYYTPKELKDYTIVQDVNTWDLVQAQKWEKEGYREKYLDYVFDVVEEVKSDIERGLSEKEIAEEKLVLRTFIGEMEPNIQVENSHSRDQRIEFNSENHKYFIDGIPAPSASTVIGKFFPEFDSYGAAARLRPSNPLYGLSPDEIVAIWFEKGKEAADKGTVLHEQIENYYLEQAYHKTEDFHLFEQFVNTHSSLEAFRCEWRVFDEQYHIAGTIDMVAKNQGVFELYDWKRSKKIINAHNGEPIKNDRWGKVGVGKLSSIDDTSYNRYCLQQSLYRYILEKNYGLVISKMYLVIMHPDYERYYKVEVPYLIDKVTYILNTL